MPNPNYSDVANPRDGSARADKPARRPVAKANTPAMPMKTAAWPGLPGKTGPDRSNGVKKCKTCPASKGM